jgi:hypothetical protein
VAKRKQRPKIVEHRPRVVLERQIVQWPACEADLRSPEAIEYRTRGIGRHNENAILRGVEGIRCGNFGSYTIDGHWYCRKHAAYIALEMLSEDP